jgi:hypothetical protein
MRSLLYICVVFLKLLHIFLAFNLLLSTTGWNVYEHFCKLKGHSISVTAPIKTCCAKKSHRNTSKQHGFNKKSCCQDANHFVKSNLQSTHPYFADHFDFQTTDFIPTTFIALNVAQNLAFVPFNQKIIRFWLYKPPSPKQDIPVLVQSFLC